MLKPVKEKAERVLVLCVDRDNDIGEKVRVRTPILGREENLNAAINLALQDPEEADANAMFEAIRIYDRLQENNVTEEHQIATITGLEVTGVEADRKIVTELTEVLELFAASGVILVTDGFTDEAVLPLIQSRVPVNSVRRIVIKHSESIEETAAVFSRYLRMIVETPYYSRPLLGIPGILIIVLAILSLIPDGLFYAWAVLLIIVGSFLLIKGFGIDVRVLRSYNWIRRYSPPPLPRQIIGFSSVAGILSIGIGCYQAGAYIFSNWELIVISVLGFYPPQELTQRLALLPSLIGHFILQSITLIVIGVCVLLLGLALRYFLERDSRMWLTFVIMVPWIWSRQILYEVSQILICPEESYGGLVMSIIIGISLTLTVALITLILNRRYLSFFAEGEETDALDEKRVNEQQN